MDSIDAVKRKLSQYFTEDELAILTPEELHLLALLDAEELPTIPEEDHVRAQAEYRARVEQALKNHPRGPK